MIQDNIIVAHEALHFLKLKKRGYVGYVGHVGQMAIKLDFNKAYDYIEWNFLSELMQKMGFHTD